MVHGAAVGDAGRRVAEKADLRMHLFLIVCLCSLISRRRHAGLLAEYPREIADIQVSQRLGDFLDGALDVDSVMGQEQGLNQFNILEKH